MYTLSLKLETELFQEDILNKRFEIARKMYNSLLSKEGDIILKLTSPIEIAYITKQTEGILITSNFTIIRLKKEINAEYITYYLNYIKPHLENLTMGSSYIKKLQLKDVMELDIPVPSLKKQKNIIKVKKIYQKELELFELKQRFYQSTLKKLFEEVMK